ncbi:uncharacterized protein LOC120339982 [Styela clava]
MNETVFNDPVHGTISLRPELVKIINTPQFQRLRNIKELSGKYFVYPGASHSRFEHSIGTAYLAGKLVRHLKENQDLEIDDRDVLCVEIAGLCHDLGHGPFSHLFDGMFMKKLKKRESEEERVENEKYLPHKDISCKMLNLLLDGIEEKIVSEEERQFIKEMIAGSGKGCTSDRCFLYEIISNKTNGVDVDKWDYFARDCHHLGIPNGFNHNRFLQFMRVLPVEKDDQYKEEGKHICVHEEECFNLYEMFRTRCSLHRRAYQHKTGNAIDHMISDALVEADKHILIRGGKVKDSKLSGPNATFLKVDEDGFYLRTISQCVNDPVAYTKLDRIFQQILQSDRDDLKKAREIFERISRGDLYRCIGDEQLKEGQIDTDEIKKKIVGYSKDIEMDDLEVSLVKLNYGDGANNPVDKYRFYLEKEQSKAKKIERDEFSNMSPAKFEEKRVQVFCKDPNKVDEAEKCFERWKNGLTMDETVFNDPVHGTISLRPELVKIINTPQFQRLRNIKQLSGKYFVYPGASHNRFEHSIGTAYLAGKLVRHLRNKQKYLRITDRDVLCVEIAGLCHDLGHGPFSHLFDRMFMKKLKKRKLDDKRVENGKYLSHEDISCKMLDLLLDGIEEKIVSKEERQFIKKMIMGSGEGCPSDRGFLYEIISNKINGVDVDKWDYFARDCHHLGIPNGFDHKRFLQFMRVLPVGQDEEKHICVHEKECFNLYEMFHTRCSLHRRAYQHKSGNAIDHMISDALVEADRHILFRGKKADPQNVDWNEAHKLENGCLKLPDPDSPNRNFLKDGNDVFHLRTISQCVEDPVAYTKLDDGIFQQILHSDGEHLKKAREILERIFRRDIYKCIGDEQLKEGQDVRVKEHEIKKQIVGDSNIIGVDDLEVSLVVLNYGDDDNNPVAKYRFYSKSEPSKAKEIKPCEFSNMLPAKFEERRIQVFCKNPGFKGEKAIEAKKRFEAWKKKNF